MSKKKAGIVADNYKVKTFRRNLKNAGFEWKEFKGPAKGVTTLTVLFDPDEFEVLKNIIIDSNLQAKDGK